MGTEGSRKKKKEKRVFFFWPSPFPAVVEDELRVEADGPRQERHPPHPLVQHMDPGTVPPATARTQDQL